MKQIPRGIWVLLAANVVIALGYGLIAPALPTFARSFDVSVAAATVIVSAFAMMRLLFAPASGKLVSWLGERRIYLTGLLIVLKQNWKNKCNGDRREEAASCTVSIDVP